MLESYSDKELSQLYQDAYRKCDKRSGAAKYVAIQLDLEKSAVALRKELAKRGIRLLGRDAQIAKTQTKEVRQKIAEQSRKNWKDPTIRQKRELGTRAASVRPGQREKISAGVKKNWEDPDRLRKHREGHNKYWTEEKRAEQGSNKAQEYKDDPTYGQKVSKTTKQRWEDPNYKKRVQESMVKAAADPQRRKDLRKAGIQSALSDHHRYPQVCEREHCGYTLTCHSQPEVFVGYLLNQSCPHPWKYTGLKGNRISLPNGSYWSPDFTIDLGDEELLLEVKGHPEAITAFVTKVVPYLDVLLPQYDIMILDSRFEQYYTLNNNSSYAGLLSASLPILEWLNQKDL